MKARVFEPARVARGTCVGVGGQHSWVVLGDDCYEAEAVLVDPTLWSYDDGVEGVWFGSYRDGRHTPFGKGSIWKWGRPDYPTGESLALTPRKPWSPGAQIFLDLLGPLDAEGWKQLAHAPVQMWPAAEIIDAICETPNPAVPGCTLEGYVPVDTSSTTRLRCSLAGKARVTGKCSQAPAFDSKDEPGDAPSESNAGARRASEIRAALVAPTGVPGWSRKEEGAPVEVQSSSR